MRFECFETTDLGQTSSRMHNGDLGLARIICDFIGDDYKLASEKSQQLYYFDEGEGVWSSGGQSYFTKAINDSFVLTRAQMFMEYKQRVDGAEEGEVAMLNKCLAGRLKSVPTLMSSIFPACVPELMDRGFEKALNSNIWLFPCANGTLDLLTGTLHDARSEHFFSWKSKVPYNAEAKCPVWVWFLKDIFSHNEEVYHFFHKFVGLCLSGDVSEQKMLIMEGMGSNGKGVIMETLLHIFGEFHGDIEYAVISDQKNASGNEASPEIAKLVNKRMVSVNEMPRNPSALGGMFKKFNDSGDITARALYGDPVTFPKTWKTIIYCNNAPQIPGETSYLRRVLLVPLGEEYVENPVGNQKKQDPMLKDKLLQEIDGILAWAVEGFALWKEERLEPVPEVMIQAKKEAVDETDWQKYFVLGQANGCTYEDRMSHGDFKRHLDACLGEAEDKGKTIKEFLTLAKKLLDAKGKDGEGKFSNFGTQGCSTHKINSLKSKGGDGKSGWAFIKPNLEMVEGFGEEEDEEAGGWFS
jgi:P4 family phage/plasmid primase-like protien